MIKVTQVSRSNIITWIHLDVDGAEAPTIFGLQDGMAEAYQGTYGLKTPEEAILLLLIDSLVPDNDSFAPESGDPDADNKVAKLVKKFRHLVDWNEQLGEVLRLGTQTGDEAKALVSLWRRQREYADEHPNSDDGPVHKAIALGEQRQQIGDGYQRMYEERQADKMVGDLPLEARKQPMDTRKFSVGLTVDI